MKRRKLPHLYLLTIGHCSDDEAVNILTAICGVDAVKAQSLIEALFDKGDVELPLTAKNEDELDNAMDMLDRVGMAYERRV